MSPAFRRFLLFALLLAPSAHAEQITVAVAANFHAPMQRIARDFEAASGHQVRLSAGSTGKHYAQIANGAPFDAFFAADAEHPAKLEQANLTVHGSRFTYALGKLVLWSPRPGLVDAQGEVLRQGGFRRLAIANPRLAPYGAAAAEALRRLDLWQALQGKLVQGENIAQAFQFVASGNAELGFVALSQLRQPGLAGGGSEWIVPPELYSPIAQQAVLLKDGEAARAFLDYVASAPARQVIAAHGYDLPPPR